MNGLEFSSRLTLLRKQKNLSKIAAAQMCGLPVGTYGSYEQGNAFPTVEKLIAIAKGYNVSTDWLLGLSSVKDRR